MDLSRRDEPEPDETSSSPVKGNDDDDVLLQQLPEHTIEKVLSREQVFKVIRDIKKGSLASRGYSSILSYSDDLSLNWGHSFLRTKDLWAYENNTLIGTGVKVAVLDTGIDPFHPDFNGAILAGKDFSGTGSWVDGNGHGTHCAGIIAARLNCGSAAGVAPGCLLLIGKVLTNDGSGSFTSVSNGIRWATDSGANVISLSLGAQTTIPLVLKRAIDYAISKNVIVVVAAGNEGKFGVGAPGSYTKCVTVGACANETGTIAPFSSVGSAVDIVAPGVNIFSTYKDGLYALMSGTSMATPFVAGIAALFVQACKFLKIIPTQSLFEAYVQRTAIDKGIRGKDMTYGFGCVAPLSIINNLYRYKTRPPSVIKTAATALTIQEIEAVFNFKSTSSYPTNLFEGDPFASDDNQKEEASWNLKIPIQLNPNHKSRLFIRDDDEYCSERPLRVFSFKGVDDNIIFMRLVRGLFTDDEVKSVIELGEDRLSTSLVRSDTGKLVKDLRRTSRSGTFTRSETPLIEAFEKRVASLVNLPQSFLEPIQILRYEKNEKYEPHYDAIHDLTTFENREAFEHGFQRIVSAFVYLSDSPQCKGACANKSTFRPETHLDEDGIPIAGMFKSPLCASTHFKNLDLSVVGKKGDVIIWTNTDSARRVIKESLHQGSPLCNGEKWALNFWFHGRESPR